jgi:hypothetical protein
VESCLVKAQTQNHLMRLQVLRATVVRMTVFWDTAPRGLVEVDGVSGMHAACIRAVSKPRFNK